MGKRNKNRHMSMEEELEELLMSRKGSSSSSSGTISAAAAAKNNWYGDIDEDEDDENIMMGELGMAIYGIDHIDKEEEEEDFYDDDDDDDDEDESANDRHNSSSNSNSSGCNNIRTRVSPSQIGYSLDDIRMYLTEDEIINDLVIDGGSSELTSILIKGALAKQKMIKSNIRLVTSISKKWFRNAPNNNKNGDFYAGSWTTPAMGEVIQQGIIGLAMAAERFEPERNFKFSTYATYYITNEVRKIFQSTTTGCLYVPQHYFVIRNKYQKLSKEYYRETGLSMDIESAAKKLNLKIPRLQFVLKSTQSLLELDSPIAQGENGAEKAGGNQGGDSGTSTYSDTLRSEEATAESIVERSLLRQCLENALAAELSPHERDIVRLRHGLDDGVSRTVMQVRESCGGMLSLADIRTVEKRAYRKLRFPYSVHNARLREFAAEYAGVAPEMIETL